MTKESSQFARLSQLRERQAEGMDDSAPVPDAIPLSELEMLDLPEPAQQQQAVTRLLSAQVPQERKLAFDQRVLEARRYYPDLEMREGVIALLSLLDDERIYRLWLHEIGKLKG